MRFNIDMTFRGRSALSSIEKNEKSKKIDVSMDHYGNESVLSFDSICFDSFLQGMKEYAEKGKVSNSCSESCCGQSDLDVFSLNLSEDKRFSVRFELADLRSDCLLILRSNYTQISFCFNGDQLKKIMDKFDNAVKAKEALARAEREVIIKPGGDDEKIRMY